MAKFINTQHIDILNTLQTDAQHKMAKTYYSQANLKNAQPVNFYNINTGASTLDEASKLAYSSHGDESPLCYDYIEDLLLYNMPAIELNFENGDFGLESSEIEGEAFIPPNIFVPIPGSFFVIQNLNHPGIFKVDDITPDTMENGANFYKIHYYYDREDFKLVDDHVINRYKFLNDKVGTEIKPLLLQEDYNFGLILQSTLTELTKFYIGLFFSERVDTFILKMNGRLFYDPFLIEFIKNNNLLYYNEEEFIVVQQQIGLSNTFALDYNDTIFRKLEKGKLDKNPVIESVGKDIFDKLSILNMRSEFYLQIKYLSSRMLDRTARDYIITNISPNLIECIKNNVTIRDSYKNIIIKFFNNSKITNEDIMTIEKINFDHNIELFYMIPIVIFILKHILENLTQ